MDLTLESDDEAPATPPRAPGTMLVELVFGIPGDTITAIVIGVLYMKGMNPGPTIFMNGGGQVYALFTVFFVANLIGFGLGPTAVALITDYGFGEDGALRHSLSIVASIVLPLSAIIVMSSMAAFRRAVDAAAEAE